LRADARALGTGTAVAEVCGRKSLSRRAFVVSLLRRRRGKVEEKAWLKKKARLN
jgi:hypothetical protein